MTPRGSSRRGNRVNRSRLLSICTLLMTILGLAPAASANLTAKLNSTADWPLWAAYKSQFIQPDGRVIEYSQNARTTSEAQAYALFHALVANDRETFRHVLKWTENNLADGSLLNQLPAWLWGKADDGSWGVLDNNSAADADMWLAYTLLEAGRHWSIEQYERLGKNLLREIEAREVVNLPDAGAMVLPAPKGFAFKNNRWKLNPSYIAPQIILRFATVGDRALWESVLSQNITMIEKVAHQGVVPDWVYFSPKTGYELGKDPRLELSSYDAVRVYLWAGMLDKNTPQRDRLLKALDTRCTLAEKIRVSTLEPEGTATAGLIAARLPYYLAIADEQCVDKARKFIGGNWHKNLLGTPPLYYDQNLALFAFGWIDQRFRFQANGQLALRGKTKNVSYWKK